MRAALLNEKTLTQRLNEKLVELQGNHSELARQLGVHRNQLEPWLNGRTPQAHKSVRGIWQQMPIVAKLMEVLDLSEEEVLALILMGRGVSSTQLKAIGNLRTLAWPIPTAGTAVAMRRAA